ncbi:MULTISPECIES: serine hydrolase domain-containing protein [Mesonia]|uniref:6-aminohexanoate-dimer hydrolase n=1 Tax=Mesonia oceanica TaxID=2687242 RepID=A0AC61Y354_9FLAO|nr:MULTISPECIES: serine hydrolase [Mesonia]MAN28647.1 serine hydrolase [Mesonia sp.]MAQ41328.1 serine hydrolase [Mesonia sp.]MBJ97427.1 serine hydrolase [Flavobacteriaceae bacterium]VVU98901.1 6-aminohexanoate-dimer hydrolase [Mesonia oceanica]|tara:strand:+ start:30483 stop:31622 length:1140 start_codon:yes stop_codon:yes gene_type:complete
MKIIKRILFVLLGFIILCVGLLYLFNKEYLLKGIRITYLKGYTTAYIDDYPEFDNRKIEAGQPQTWPEHTAYNSVKATKKLQQINQKLGTVAFLIIKNDSIWYEDYAEGYSADSKTNSFSMAKSITSALLGKAIRDGFIENLDQPVADFYSQFDKRLTVGDLSSMASGLNWQEDYYNPFGMTARAYLDENIREQILNLKVIEEPGKEFKYLSGNTELLGMVIEKATGKNLSQYLSESFWKPLGMHESALWQLDSEESGMEKAYCCIASNARDFAKFGKLYSNQGNFEGKQLLDSSFIQKSILPRFKETPFYGYGFWLSNFMKKKIFAMRGILGQYVISIPEDQLIIVRLGRQRGKKLEDKKFTQDFYTYIRESYKMLNN